MFIYMQNDIFWQFTRIKWSRGWPYPKLKNKNDHLSYKM